MNDNNIELFIFILIVILIITLVCFYISYKNFKNNITDISYEIETTNKIDNKEKANIKKEIDRYDNFKKSLNEVRQNVKALDIISPEELKSTDNMTTSLNKISVFFEKYNKETVGTEQLILSILPISQTGDCLMAFGSSIGEGLSSSFIEGASIIQNSIQNATVSPDLLGKCFHQCMIGIGEYLKMPVHQHILQSMFEHEQYLNASGKLITAGLNHGLEPILHHHEALHSAFENMHEHVGAGLHDVAGHIATGTMDIDVSGHVPYFTIVISSIREIQLLSNGMTDVYSAVKNGALDVTGSGVGGFGGGHVGGMLGALLGGPLGWMIGSILGAVLGAIGGRTLTNKIKQYPLNKAMKKYEESYHNMKNDTETKSKETLNSIHDFVSQKRKDFKDNPTVQNCNYPNKDIDVKIANILYKALLFEIKMMKSNAAKIRKSLWYRQGKYKMLYDRYIGAIAKLERNMVSIDIVNRNPSLAVDLLLSVEIPSQKSSFTFKKKVVECRDEIKSSNEKNSSALFAWSLAVNGLYQQTISEIADFSSKEMKSLNEVFSKWKVILEEMQNKVIKERNKLGIK